MKLIEVFNSTLDSLLQRTSWGWQGAFSWDDATFIVELRKRSIEEVPRSWRGYEASFFLADVAGDDAFSTADDDEGNPKHSEVPVKVYGVVLNALLDVWASNEVDAIYFTAEPRHATNADQHERKVAKYEMLARRAQRQGGGYLYVHRGVFDAWVLCKSEVANEYWTNALHEGLTELLRSGYDIQRI